MSTAGSPTRAAGCAKAGRPRRPARSGSRSRRRRVSSLRRRSRDDRQPITAALTALLIVQVTFFGTLTDTCAASSACSPGSALAIVASQLVGLTWWSLGAIMLVSIIIGQALRLGPHLLEVPISAMLILAAGGAAGVRAFDRVTRR